MKNLTCKICGASFVPDDKKQKEKEICRKCLKLKSMKGGKVKNGKL